MLNKEIEYSYCYDLKEEFKPDPEARVHFRPHRKWDGEFGFDWVRTGDTNWGDKDNPFFYYPFEDIVGFYDTGKKDEELKKIYNETQDRKSVLNALLNTYRTLPIINKTDSQIRYYVPKMTIMKGVTARLDLYIECEKSIDKIEFRIIGNEEKSIQLDKNEIHNINRSKAKIQLEVQCNSEFNKKIVIEAYASNKKTIDSLLCGTFEVLPNSEKFQKKIDILLVQVNTNLNGAVVSTNLKGMDQAITKFFNQALLIPNIKNYSIDLLDEDFSKHFSSYIKEATANIELITSMSRSTTYEGTKILSHHPMAQMTEYIVNVLSQKIPKEYNKYYKVYLLEEEAFQAIPGTGEPFPERLGGGSLHGNRYNICCYKGGTEPVTVTHEIFHSLGLKHLFYKLWQRFEKYKFKTKYTSNIMDYFTTRINTFYWQWKILNKKIK